MTNNADAQHRSFGLLSSGTSGHWTVDLDEPLDGTEWSLQLDGPQFYLACEVRDLGVIRSAVDYLRSNRKRDDAMMLGRFDTACVSLHRDNEDPERCFLIVGPSDRATMRLTLSTADTGMLAEALEQIQEDLPTELMK